MSNSNRVTDCHGGMTDCHSHDDNLSLPIPKTTTETTTEISITTQSVDKPLVVINENIKLIEDNTHLLLDSKNKQNKVSEWKKDIDSYKDASSFNSHSYL